MPGMFIPVSQPSLYKIPSDIVSIQERLHDLTVGVKAELAKHDSPYVTGEYPAGTLLTSLDNSQQTPEGHFPAPIEMRLGTNINALIANAPSNPAISDLRNAFFTYNRTQDHVTRPETLLKNIAKVDAELGTALVKMGAGPLHWQD